MKTITVPFGERAYRVTIGCGALESGDWAHFVDRRERCAVIVSQRVLELHGAYIERVLAGLESTDLFPMPDGEERKSYAHAERYFNELLSRGYGRGATVIAIGGGVVGDFAGFVAAAYMRGVRFIQVPTTLLAMVDASIGGKVAVNISAGKNIVGAFHQPAAVVADIAFIETLPDEELKNGIAESLKHALIGEPSLCTMLRENDLASIRRPDTLEELVFRSAGFKAGVVSQDEREGGLRAILNFGHTAGHAIESCLEYRGIMHGAAVAAGMQIAIDLSRARGLLDERAAREYRELAARYDLIPRGLALDAAQVVAHMRYDKKNAGGEIRFVLLAGVGEPRINQPVPEGELRAAVDDFLAG